MADFIVASSSFLMWAIVDGAPMAPIDPCRFLFGYEILYCRNILLVVRLPKEFLQPGSVAVIGASRNPEKVGSASSRTRGRRDSRTGIRGNPSGGELLGHALYPPSTHPGSVDLGVFVVPPKRSGGIPALAARE